MTSAQTPPVAPRDPVTPDTLAVHEVAAEWRIRTQHDSWSDADQQALDRWLAADNAHRAAFESLAMTWHAFAAVPRPVLASESAAKPDFATTPRHDTLHTRGVGRHRAWFAPAFAFASLVLCVGGWFAYDNLPSYRLDLRTAHGEIRTVTLPDGSAVALNTDTEVQVRYYPRRREVVLREGEAYFQVAHGAERPFTVASGRTEVRVVGTMFNVDAGPQNLVVSVREGRVEVSPDREARDHVIVLTANRGVAVDTITGATVAFSPHADDVGDWRSGQLAFRRTPLSQVAQTLSRYLGKPVTLDSPALGALPVSGFATTTAPRVFLESLPDLLPVRVQPQPDGGVRIISNK